MDLAEYNINLHVAEADPAKLTTFDGSNSANDRGGHRDSAPPSGHSIGGTHGNGGSDRNRGRGHYGGHGHARPDSSGRRSKPLPLVPSTAYTGPYGMALPTPHPG